MFQEINNISPSTFFSRLPINILDGGKKLFYFHPNKEKGITFNLPIGKFFSETKVEKLKDFVPYDFIPLPVKVTSDMIPKDFKTCVGKNKNKASITLASNSVLFDKTVYNHPFAPFVVFVGGHEAFHHIFHHNPETDEQNCDNGSYNLMMLSGYNPLQVKVCKGIAFKNNSVRNNCLNNAINSNTKRR